MVMSELHFQYCQKIIVLSSNKTKVLLCKRKGENDFDGIFSFIGGKMEVTDETIIDGLKREKNEEVGEDFKVKIYPTYSTNLLFRKKDGNTMILPHYLSIYQNGKIKLNEEYSEYKWVNINDIESFEPKIPTIPNVLTKILNLEKITKETDFIII